MKPLAYTLVAMLFYAMASVALEQKFSKYNNLTLIVCYTSVIFVLAVIVRYFTKTTDPVFNFPAGVDLVLVLALDVVYLLADYFYIGAYTMGGNLLGIVCITMMMPVFASVIKFMITRQTPNLWFVGGYAFAVLAVLMVAKGTSIQSSIR